MVEYAFLSGRAVQPVDGRHRRNGAGDVVARRRTAYRATRARLQIRRRWPEVARPERGVGLSVVSDLPARGRDALGLLPAIPDGHSTARVTAARSSRRLRLSDLHADRRAQYP